MSTKPQSPAALHPVVTGSNLLPQLPRLLSGFGLSGRAFIISDTDVLPLYGGEVRESLESGGWRVCATAVAAGETSKTIEQAQRLWDWLVEQSARRSDLVIALGGGVVGDLAGWVAATYLRGIKLVQMPTNLLAMVDSSIGGKTGVNHPGAKNLIGSFYPPIATIVDTRFLATLPVTELRCGWTEAIKTTLIADEGLFRFLEDNADALQRLEPGLITHVVGCCAGIKLRIVTEDPKEAGLRAILNYGHTIGHALENAAGYGTLLHGEAVAIGMRGAARIARRMGILGEEAAARQNALLDRFELPEKCLGLDIEHVLSSMQLDKKMTTQGLRWVLLSDIGQPRLRTDVPPELVREVVEGLIT